MPYVTVKHYRESLVASPNLSFALTLTNLEDKFDTHFHDLDVIIKQ